MKTLINNYKVNKSIISKNFTKTERLEINLNSLIISLLILIPSIFLLTPFYLDVKVQLLISFLIILVVCLIVLFYFYLNFRQYNLKIKEETIKLHLTLLPSIFIIMPIIIIGIILIVIFL